MKTKLVFVAVVAAMRCVAADGLAVSGERAGVALDSQLTTLARLGDAQTALDARLAEQEAQMRRLLDMVDSRADLRKAYHGAVVGQYVLTNAATGIIARYDLHADGRAFTNLAARVSVPDPEAKRKAVLEAERRQSAYEALILPAEIAELRARQRAAAKGLTYNLATRQAE